MTVSKTTSSATFFGNGAATAFSLPFYVSPTDALRLYVVDEAGVMDQVLSGFSFVGNKTAETTALTFTSAPISGAEFYAVRETAPSQLVSLKGQVSYNPTVVEGVWDKLTRLIQEVQAGAGKLLRTTTVIPPVKLIPGRVLTVNDAGTEVVCGPSVQGISEAAANAEAAAASAEAAAESAAAAVAAEMAGSANGTPNYGTRAAAIAAAVPLLAQQIIVEGVIYRRDEAGTALTTGDGGKWSPLLNITPQAFGADGAGGDAGTAITAMQAHLNATGGKVTVPKGSYLLSGVTYDIGHEAVIHKASTIAVNLLSSARNNVMLFVVDTPEDTVLNGAHARVPISVTVRGRGAQHASGVRSNLVNHSTDGQGNTAFYGNATSYPTALWSAALHGETRHAGGTAICLNLEAASFTMSGAFYGAVISNTTANGHVSHPFGSPAVGHPGATAVLIQGTVNSAASGGWVYGLDFSPTSMRLGGTDIRIRTTSARHIHVEAEAPASNADILLEANSANGLALRGSYSGSAISIPAGQKIGLEPTGGIGVRYNSGNNRVEFLNGSNVRGYIDMAAGTNVKMN